MANALDTPTSGELAAGDEDGRRILKEIRVHLRETGAAIGQVEKSSYDIGGPRLRRRVARVASVLREFADVQDDLIRAAEKWSTGFDVITRRDLPAAAPAMSDITPDTQVRMTTSKFIVVVVAIVSAVAGMVGAWITVSNAVAVHISNSDVHLDPGYQRDHGRPVGKWDLDAYKAETSRKLDDLAEKQNRILDMLVNPRKTTNGGR